MKYMMRPFTKSMIVCLVVMFLVIACNVNEDSSATSIVTLKAQDSLEYPENTTVTALWNSYMCPATLCYLSVFEDGTVASWNLTSRRSWGVQGTLTESELLEVETIVDSLSTSVASTHSIGTFAIRVIIKGDEKNGIECGSRNCSILVRRLFEIVGVRLKDELSARHWSPFSDEGFHILHPFPLSVIQITWYESSHGDYKIVTFNSNGVLSVMKREEYEQPLLEMQGRLSSEDIKRIQSCQESLVLFGQAVTGEDWQLIKVSFDANGQRTLFRFDKRNLPTCLKEFFVIAESAINQSNPGINYTLDPIGSVQ